MDYAVSDGRVMLNYYLGRMLKDAMVCGSLSPWHVMSSGCGWGIWPPDMEGNCKYIE
jgi:hypothetical protein